MKKIIFIIVLFLTTNISSAENIYSGLQNLEQNILQETYEYDIPQSRIERLETKMFGALQHGSLEERYTLLKNASNNYKAYNNYRTYNQYRPPIFTGTSGSGWKRTLLGNFKNQFSGYPTGLTPSLKPGMDPSYMDYFEAERALSKNNYGYYNDYRTPRGYRTTRTDRSSRTGVTILD